MESSASRIQDTSDYFLGRKPAGNERIEVDLGDIVRNVDELVILTTKPTTSMTRVSLGLRRLRIFIFAENERRTIQFQVDVTATPKQNNGSIFVQTVTDYPLVEAIHQNVVKHPVLPDAASRAKLQEHQEFHLQREIQDYLQLGFLGMEEVYDEHIKLDKKAVLFVMTDDTKNCDEVAEYLENTYPELKDGVLVIHTKNNGEISEGVTGKKRRRTENSPSRGELDRSAGQSLQGHCLGADA